MLGFKHVVDNDSLEFEKSIAFYVTQFGKENFKFKSIAYSCGNAMQGQAFTALIVFEYQPPKEISKQGSLDLG